MLCQSTSELQREYGAERARKIQRRLITLRDLPTLDDVPQTAPIRRKPLDNDKSRFSVSIDEQAKIIFTPHDQHQRIINSQETDLRKITSVIILQVCKE